MRPKGSNKTPGSGRKKGSVNKRTTLARTVAEGLQKAGVCPVDVLAKALSGTIKSDLKIKAAHILMPYLHAAKAAELRIGGVAGAPLEHGPIQIVIDYGDSSSGDISNQPSPAPSGTAEGDE